MKKISFYVDDDCKLCKKALSYLKKLHKRNTRAYGCYILHPVSRLIKEKRDLGEQDRIKGVTLIPDYNSCGTLTHFHITKEGDNGKEKKKSK